MTRPHDWIKILHNEKGQKVHQTCINGFAENILIWGQMSPFGLKMACGH